MITIKIEELLERNDAFTRLNLTDASYIHAVFASSDNIVVLCPFKSEGHLEEEWEYASEEAAILVQSRLHEEYSSLRWDIYLLYIAEEFEVTSETRVRIENDRQFFRKRIIDYSEERSFNKLPFLFEGMTVDSRNLLEQQFLFNYDEFFDELRSCIPLQTAEVLGEGFFKKSNWNPDELFSYMGRIKR